MQKPPVQLVLGASFAALTAAFGCASTPTEVDLPPQSLTEAPTSTAEQEAALVASDRPVPADPEEEVVPTEAVGHPESEPVKKESELAGRKHTIVIQSGTTTDVTPLTLQQASASERERRAASDAPVAVINNSNLADLAEGGQISIVGAPGDGAAVAAVPGGGEKGAAATPSAGAAAAASPSSTATKTAPPAGGTASPELAEEYWRAQALKIRLDWKAAVEEVDELQSEVADLRRRFYEEDDPFYRDNEIKPSWDRALDRLQEAKADAETQERKLTRFLEEGRRSGALPGWLREGYEFEPQATADHSPSERRRTDDPWEPKVLEEEPRDP